jgi:glycosyltransferase involved in cell wall biosynthesis
MFKPLVSVIIPCYNDYMFIDEAVSSIYKQKYENIEIIIVDDGSKSRTKKKLRSLQEKGIRVLTQSNSGPSAARNNGILNSKGEYIVTLDSDDYFEPEFIIKAITVLEKFPEVGLVTSCAILFSKSGIERKVELNGGKPVDFLIQNGALASCMFRKRCWEDVGGYDEKLIQGYEDWDYNISVVKQGWKVKVIREFLFNYRIRLNSRNQVADDSHKYELMRYLYIKHKDVFIQNFDRMIEHLFKQMELLEAEKIQLRKTTTYKVGDLILGPFKWLKDLIKKK